MVKVKMPQRLSDISRRINNLPKLYVDAIEAISKKDAVGFIVEFENGLAGNLLGLKPLSESTVASKKKKIIAGRKPRYMARVTRAAIHLYGPCACARQRMDGGLTLGRVHTIAV